MPNVTKRDHPVFFSRVRLIQIKIAVRILRVIDQIDTEENVVRLIRRSQIGRSLLDLLFGFRKTFPSISEAEKAIMPYANKGHLHFENLDFHSQIKTRPSDYAALFHLSNQIGSIKRVFDMGGNVGNIFYCYEKYLDFPNEFSWTVYDFPFNLTVGRALAKEKGAKHLRFTEDQIEANGVDVLLISGSLHYFPPLSQFLEKLTQKPRYILINRTPLISGESVAVVQDAGSFRVACTLYDRKQLQNSLILLGYKLLDEWQVYELSLVVPGNPDYRVSQYTGMWFQLIDD